MGKRSKRKLTDTQDADVLSSIPISSSALARVVAKIQQLRPSEATLKSLSSRQQLDRDRKKAFTQFGDVTPLNLPLGEALPTHPGIFNFRWYICDIARYMQHAVDAYPGYRALVTDTFRRSPCIPDRPWRFIMSFDEFVPGAVLKQDNARKAWTWLLSVIEFGPNMLQHLGAWVPVGLLRTEVVKRVPGGLSRVGVELMLRLSGLHTNGFVLNLDSGPTMIFMKFDGPLADGAGLQYYLGAKGASGTVPCFSCSNVVAFEEVEEADAADALRIHDPDVVDISTNDPEKFRRVSMARRFVQADTLMEVRGRVTNEAFGQVEQAYGINCNPHHIYFDKRVRDVVASMHARYDPMHCVFQHGVAEVELTFLLSDLKRINITLQDLDTVCAADWKMPLGKKGLLKHFFTVKRQRRFDSAGTFQVSASEMVSAIPLILYFLETIPLIGENLPLQVDSWRALALLTRQLLRAKVGIGTPPELESAIKSHGEKYALAYGERPYAYIPKYHHTKHLPEQFELDEFLIDCYVTERANIIFKAAAEPVKNTKGKEASRWETTVEECVWKHHAPFLGKLVPDGFVNGCDCPELGNGATLALSCVSRGVELQDGDIVFLDDCRPFLLAAFASLPAGFFYLGCHCRLVERKTSNAAYYKPDAELDFVKLPEAMRLAPMYGREVRGLLIFDA